MLAVRRNLTQLNFHLGIVKCRKSVYFIDFFYLLVFKGGSKLKDPE